MKYTINRDDMRAKVDRLLHDFGDLYTFDDICDAIEAGKMQSFVSGETWIITQVLEFPRKKVLEITFVVGFMGDALAALPGIENFARQIGATRITGFGRDGWWGYAMPGWEKAGTMYAKDLTDGS